MFTCWEHCFQFVGAQRLLPLLTNNNCLLVLYTKNALSDNYKRTKSWCIYERGTCGNEIMKATEPKAASASGCSKMGDINRQERSEVKVDTFRYS